MNLGSIVETRTYVDVVDPNDGEVCELRSLYQPEPGTGLQRGVKPMFGALILRRPNGGLWSVFAGHLATKRLVLRATRRVELS